ncbi:MAG: M81 family metallopeptidase [Defluviitaleaceae bacterium]|nr:M81 family metallopeptidase [Defluviitaleaceae bacterium]
MKRIFATGISQESNSFNPLKSTYEDFTIYSGQEFRRMAGLSRLIESGFDVVESIWAKAVPGGTLKFEDFMRLADEMLKPLEEDKVGFDGVFLPMHGALNVEYIGSGEAFIANKIREIVGGDVPISAALDMHANITYSLANTCNIIYGFRTAPHIDVQETHAKAAELLIRAVKEGILPRSELIRIPLMMPGENMMTSSGIGKEIIAMLPDIEKNENKDIWCASYFVGMAWVDCPRNGAAFVISGAGDMEKGLDKAGDLARFAWDNRGKFEYQGLKMEPLEAVNFVIDRQSDRPVILSDSADNVTAGAVGDNTFMLNLFLAKGIEKALFAAIIDPNAVEVAKELETGGTLDIQIGGVFDKNSVKTMLKGAVIKHLTLNLEADKPKSCVLSYKGIDILLFDKRKPVFTEETLNEHGLSLENYNILVVKQGYLSPELNEAAKHSVMALTPGNCSQKIEEIRYEKVRRPVWPLDENTVF